MADEPQDPNEPSPDETIAGINLPPPPGATPPPPGAPPPPAADERPPPPTEHLPPPPDQPTPPPTAPPPPDQPTPPPAVPATPPPGGYAAAPPAKKGGAKWGFALLGVLLVIALGLGAFLILSGDDDGGEAKPGNGTDDPTDPTTDPTSETDGPDDPGDLPPIDGDLEADPLTTVSGLNEAGFDIGVNNIAEDPAGGFVAVGNRTDSDTGDSEQLVWRSDDGETWEEVDTTGLDSGPAAEVPQMSSLVSDGDQFVAVGALIDADGVRIPVAWSSPDGEAWEEADVAGIDDFGAEEQMIGVTTDPDGGFLAVGSLFVETGEEDVPFEEDPGVWRSDDGTTWEQVETTGLEDPDTGDFLAGVVSSDDGFIGVGSGFLLDGPSRDPLIWSSSDGESWDLVETDGLGDDDRNEFPLAITNAADGGFIAVGNAFDLGGSNRDPLVLVSPDGDDWEVADNRLFTASLDELLNGVVPDGDGFLAGGATIDEPIEGTIWRLQFG